jgi:cyclopropane fatty-acyl-phospholipid synthase-like methyltransferase
VTRRVERWSVAIVCVAIALCGCGRPWHGRNVYGYPEDDRLVDRCTTGTGTTVTLYINEAGGAAVGVSYSVTTERKPQLTERQVMYSDYQPELFSLICVNDGFDLITSIGAMHFNDRETDSLHAAPRNLGEEYRRTHASSPR